MWAQTPAHSPSAMPVSCSRRGRTAVPWGTGGWSARRSRDRRLHEHVVISPRVKGPDGRWRNLDSPLLLRDVVAASELFNQRALELVCSRLGLATEEVEVTPGQRPVMTIVGIDRRLRAVFAQRSHTVRTMADTLFDAYRRRHGRQPARPARTRLQWQATVKTRPPKRQARSLDDLLADWRHRAIAVTDRTTVDNLLATARAAAQGRPAPTAFDVATAAEEVLTAVTERRTTFRRRHVLAEARRHLMRTLAGATAPLQAAEEITDRVLAHGDCLDITPPEINPPHPDLQRADGTNIYRPIGSQTYTTHSLLTAENRLLAAARTSVIPPVGRGTSARVAALHRGPMDARLMGGHGGARRRVGGALRSAGQSDSERPQAVARARTEKAGSPPRRRSVTRLPSKDRFIADRAMPAVRQSQNPAGPAGPGPPAAAGAGASASTGGDSGLGGRAGRPGARMSREADR
ncbi:relaxase domain-containing protein [Streptomyces sp. NPDC005706]|uniref:relaxase domain-containing protein n=1 Tax=Streptomyces sp. NPDC005706 TaxID=3157169 RepID=UPI0033E90A71